MGEAEHTLRQHNKKEQIVLQKRVDTLSSMKKAKIHKGIQTSSLGPMIDTEALSKWMVPKATVEVNYVKADTVAWINHVKIECKAEVDCVDKVASDKSLKLVTVGQSIKDVAAHIAKIEAQAERCHLRLQEMSYSMLLHIFWHKDSTILQHLGPDKEEYTQRVKAIKFDTYFEEFGLHHNDDEFVKELAEDLQSEHSAEISCLKQNVVAIFLSFRFSEGRGKVCNRVQAKFHLRKQSWTCINVQSCIATSLVELVTIPRTLQSNITVLGAKTDSVLDLLPTKCGPLEIVATCSSNGGRARPEGYGFPSPEANIATASGAVRSGSARSCDTRVDYDPLLVDDLWLLCTHSLEYPLGWSTLCTLGTGTCEVNPEAGAVGVGVRGTLNARI
uniref:Uncharacterized protein n=1 Tax=Cannabis sativa TaxID=3483 RepID=A0A803NIF9_CANSA